MKHFNLEIIHKAANLYSRDVALFKVSKSTNGKYFVKAIGGHSLGSALIDSMREYILDECGFKFQWFIKSENSIVIYQ
jgi:hypothetical protein